MERSLSAGELLHNLSFVSFRVISWIRFPRSGKTLHELVWSALTCQRFPGGDKSPHSKIHFLPRLFASRRLNTRSPPLSPRTRVLKAGVDG